jgi:hypothetical protein
MFEMCVDLRHVGAKGVRASIIGFDRKVDLRRWGLEGVDLCRPGRLLLTFIYYGCSRISSAEQKCGSEGL